MANTVRKSWKPLMFSLVLIGATALITNRAWSDDDPPAAKPGSEEAKMAEMMEAWMKLAATNEHHEAIKMMAGKWDMKVQHRMSSEMPWQESDATASGEMIMDGRFLMTHVEGNMPGMGPFRGISVLGYDNAKKAYVASWIENMGTMMMISEGSANKDRTEITLTAKYFDPMLGKEQTMRNVYTIKGKDNFIYESYMKGMDGKEFKGMVVTHTRAKTATADKGDS